MDLLQLLVSSGVIDSAKAVELRAEIAKPGASAETVLTKEGISLAQILKAKGDYYGIPTREIGEKSVPFDVLRFVPEESARHYRFAPLNVIDGALEVGVTDPDNLEARDALTFISAKVGIPYKIFLITDTDFDHLLTLYKGLSGEVGKALGELETDLAVETQKDEKEGKKRTSVNLEETEITETGAEAITEDAPVTKIVATVLRHAAEQRASDIHIEPLQDQSRVRFRIDGVLITNITLPSKVHSAVVARIKVLSNMRLDEKRKPQDGRFSARVSGNKVDFRVSTFPTYYGEKVVMRILGASAKVLKLDDLGLSKRNLALIRTAIKKPYGLVLISGPTGSGKSTTLYGLLNEVDREKQNVLSLEDPVEYTIPGVSQSQVRPEIGYTFANGLRTTLRQDPNIIMVGEIRDSETANLAVQAALTGHLVLSTIHTNNAIGIVPRLLDMGVEPYLIPPVLILGMAQRLVKTLCPGGGKKMPVEGATKEMLEKQFSDLPKDLRSEVPSMDEVYRLEQTADCPSGTRGRVAVFEMYDMNLDLERAILANKPEDEFYSIVRKNGMLTMKEDAIIKSAEGLVPFEEVNTLGGEFELGDPALEVPAPAPVVLSEEGEDDIAAAPAEKEIKI
ncbi:MAG: putative type II secretion system protein E [Parcubacteria group bacterium Gr01-1014_56]|nr:MAG: putative type II secretion system protein E [Parcubacteria group bacterium Gr01-1014_56]